MASKSDYAASKDPIKQLDVASDAALFQRCATLLARAVTTVDGARIALMPFDREGQDEDHDNVFEFLGPDGHNSKLSLVQALNIEKSDNSDNNSSSAGSSTTCSSTGNAEECVAEVNNWTRSFWTLRNACAVAGLAGGGGATRAASDTTILAENSTDIAWRGNAAQAAVREHGVLALGVSFALAAVDIAPPEKLNRPSLSHPKENAPPPYSTSLSPSPSFESPEGAAAVAAAVASSEASPPGRGPSGDDLVRAALDRALLGCLQMLCNAVTGCGANQALLWGLLCHYPKRGPDRLLSEASSAAATTPPETAELGAAVESSRSSESPLAAAARAAREVSAEPPAPLAAAAERVSPPQLPLHLMPPAWLCNGVFEESTAWQQASQVRTSDRVLDLLIGCGRRTQQKGRRQCLAVMVAMLHNSCVVPPEQALDRETTAQTGIETAALRLQSLANDKVLVSVLLRLAAPSTSSGSSSSKEEGGAGEEEEGPSIKEEEESNDEAGEWIVMLLEQCLRRGFLAQLWGASSAGAESMAGEKVGEDEDGSSTSTSTSSNSEVAAVPIAATAEQLVLLHATAAILKDWRPAAADGGANDDSDGGDGNAHSHKHTAAAAVAPEKTQSVCVALVDILASMPPRQRPPRRDAMHVADSSSSSGSTTCSAGSDTDRTDGISSPSPLMATALMHYELNEAGRSIVLEALADAVNTAAPSEISKRTRRESNKRQGDMGGGGEGGDRASASDDDVSLRSALVSAGLVPLVVQLLHDGTPTVDASQPPGAKASDKPKTTPPRQQQQQQRQQLLPEGRRVLLTRLAGNLAWKCRPAQGAFGATPGGLAAVLNQCNLDKEDTRPGSMFLREWGIFAVRCLVLDHPSNQSAVDALVPQAIDPRSLERPGDLYGVQHPNDSGSDGQGSSHDSSSSSRRTNRSSSNCSKLSGEAGSGSLGSTAHNKDGAKSGCAVSPPSANATQPQQSNRRTAVVPSLEVDPATGRASVRFRPAPGP